MSVKQTMENTEALLRRLREYTVRVQWKSKRLVIPLAGEYRDYWVSPVLRQELFKAQTCMNVDIASDGLGRASVSISVPAAGLISSLGSPSLDNGKLVPPLTAEEFYLYEREQNQGHCCESEQYGFFLWMCTSYLHGSVSDKMKQVGYFLLKMQTIFYYSPLHSLAL